MKNFISNYQNNIIIILLIFTCSIFSPFYSFNQISITYVNEDNKSGWACNSKDDPEPWVLEVTKDWMGQLPDTKLLRDVSIPGTHDSGATKGGIAAECQDWTISEQLNAGIRFLDIRCRRTGTSFAIHHGSYFQDIMFGDVMNQISTFLKKHPKEVIIMNLQEEHTSQEGSKSFQEIWDTYAQQYSQWIFNGYNDNPKLGDLRGKVYLMCNAACNGHGTRFNSVSEKQNYYKVYWLAHRYTNPDDNYATLPSKVDLIKQYIDIASSSSSGWVINFLSGSTGMTPYEVAKSTNPPTYDYIGRGGNIKKLGIIVMDFPGEKLIYRIVKSNFEFKASFTNKSVNPQTIKVDNNNDQIDIKFDIKTDIGSSTIFSLSTANSITWWKGIKVFDINGKEICLLEMQDNIHYRKSRLFSTLEFGKQVKVEFWKAKAFGAHTNVGTKYLNLSDIQGKEVSFTWKND